MMAGKYRTVDESYVLYRTLALGNVLGNIRQVMHHLYSEPSPSVVLPLLASHSLGVLLCLP